METKYTFIGPAEYDELRQFAEKETIFIYLAAWNEPKIIQIVEYRERLLIVADGIAIFESEKIV